MIRLTLADLRESWLGWLGVCLAFITTTAILVLTVVVMTSASAARDAGEITAADRSLVVSGYGSINLVLGALVGMAVIGGSTSLVVTSRRGAIARLLLAGTTPGQMVRLLTGQIAVVALVTGLVGASVAMLLAQPVIDIIVEDRDLSPFEAEFSLPAILATVVAGMLLAVVGGLRQSRAATRIPPVEALREATSGVARHEGWVRKGLRLVQFVLCFAAVAAMFVGFRATYEDLKDDALMTLMQYASFAIPIIGLGLAGILPWVAGPITAAWTRVLPVPTPAWHLARHTVVAKSDRLVRSIVPVMFAVGLLFGLMMMGETLVETLARTMPGVTLEGTSATTLLTMFGGALAIAVAGSVGNLVMMSRQRSAELALDGIVGATPTQQILVPAFEALIITVTASALGLIMALAGGLLISYGLGLMELDAPLTIPWDLLAVSVVVCALVVGAATILPVLASLQRPAPKVIARLVAS